MSQENPVITATRKPYEVTAIRFHPDNLTAIMKFLEKAVPFTRFEAKTEDRGVTLTGSLNGAPIAVGDWLVMDGVGRVRVWGRNYFWDNFEVEG